MMSFKSIIVFITAFFIAQAQHIRHLEDSEVDKTSSTQNNFEICVITKDQDCNYSFLNANLSEGKTYWIVMPGGDTKCLDGSPFGFQVFPATITPEEPTEDPTDTHPTGEPTEDPTCIHPTGEPTGHPNVTHPTDVPRKTNKLMLWFQGGGACFSYQTCVAAPTAVTRMFPNEFGIFNMTLDGNPLVAGEWATVVNNYCTGDLHFGDSMPELTSSDGLDTVTVFHNGYNNTKSVLTWIKRQPEFPSEQEIAIGGCSAGSVAVQVWANALINHYGVDKILSDSYIGYFPPEGNLILKYWNACTTMKRLEISEVLIEQCENGNLHTLPPIFEDFLMKNPSFPVAYTGSKQDAVQIGLYALLTVPDYSGDPTELLPGLIYATQTFPTYQWNVLTSYRAIDKNFSDYIVDTEEHCFFYKDRIYTDPTFNSPYSNQTMLEYFSNFLNDDVYDGSPNYPIGFSSLLSSSNIMDLFLKYLQDIESKNQYSLDHK